MKNFISKKQNTSPSPLHFANCKLPLALCPLPLASRPLQIALCLLLFASCGEKGVKLNADDRLAIDTLSANAIKTLAVELDKNCKDSADVLRKQLVDSLVAVREREIIMQTLPPNH